MSKVSIIIPVYNSEAYLKECLDSVISQSFNDIEIICVNDGSTDNSLSILNNYAMSDNRISVTTQENQGLAVSRNTGLKIATGDYILFLDSDDYLLPNAIINLYNAVCRTKSDIIAGRAIAFADDNSEETLHRTQKTNDWLDNLNLDNYKVTIDNYLKTIDSYNCVAWGKLYSRKFLQDYNLTFINENVAHEDNGFWLKICACFPDMTYINNPVLMYRMRTKSIMADIDKAENSNKKLLHTKKVIVDVFNYVENFVSKNFRDYIIIQIQNSYYYNLCKNSELDNLYPKSNFTDKIFSIKYADLKHKVLTIFGIRIKFNI